jgi:hypothetical protein
VVGDEQRVVAVKVPLVTIEPVGGVEQAGVVEAMADRSWHSRSACAHPMDRSLLVAHAGYSR